MLQKRGDKGVLFGKSNKQKAKLPGKVKCNAIKPEMQHTVL